MDRNFRLLVLGVVLVQLATLKETSFVVLGKVSYGKQHLLEPKKWWLARIFSASGHENWRFRKWILNTHWQIALLLSIASHWKVLLFENARAHNSHDQYVYMFFEWLFCKDLCANFANLHGSWPRNKQQTEEGGSSSRCLVKNSSDGTDRFRFGMVRSGI